MRNLASGLACLAALPMAAGINLRPGTRALQAADPKALTNVTVWKSPDDRASMALPTGGLGTTPGLMAASGANFSINYVDEEYETSSQALIGGDDRVAFDYTALPDRLFGKLIFGPGSCTAQLVGESLIATAAHCFYEANMAKAESLADYHFYLGMHRLNSTTAAYVAKAGIARAMIGTTAPVNDPASPTNHPDGRDWVLAELDKPLGKTYGYLSVKAVNTSDLIRRGNQFGVIGYSVDKYATTAGKHAGCSVLPGSTDTQVWHNCDTYPGASGGALYDLVDMSLVGIHVAAGDPNASNLATPSGSFFTTLLQMKDGKLT